MKRIQDTRVAEAGLSGSRREAAVGGGMRENAAQYILSILALLHWPSRPPVSHTSRVKASTSCSSSRGSATVTVMLLEILIKDCMRCQTPLELSFPDPCQYQ